MSHKLKVAALFIIVFTMASAARNFPLSYAAAAATATTFNSLQQQIDADNQQIIVLNQQIAEYQKKLQQIGSDKKTLQAAINALDLQRSKVQAQVAVTERQINTTQLQIQQLGGEITDTEQAIATDQDSAWGISENSPESRRHSRLSCS